MRYPAATEATTLLDVLAWHVDQHPERLHATVLEDETKIIGTLSYGELAIAARAVAAGLIERDILPGDRVALMLPTGTDFFVAFFGILYAGAVPVPIYPPMQRRRSRITRVRQAGILRNAGARMLITVPEGLKLGALLQGLVATLTAVESAATLSVRSAEIAAARPAAGQRHCADPIHLGKHRRSQGRGAQSTPICLPISGRSAASFAQPPPTCSSVGCRSITTWD